jgi:FkbM family methyltransferase
MSMSAANGRFVSYSINREDVYLNRLFGEQAAGFFVDVGAAHPMFENDTKALYDRGWNGINIEPNAEFFDLLAAERPRDRNLNMAVSGSTGELTFYQVVGTGLSTVDVGEAERARGKGFEVIERRVATDTLGHILEASGATAIDILKVDVEGSELRVLQSNDWARFRPRVILVEATFPETPVRRPDEVTPYLETQGYRRSFFDGLNDYYVEHGFDVPSHAFEPPVNVFDRFVPHAEVLMTAARDSLQDQVTALREEQANAQAYTASLTEALEAVRTALSAEQGNAAQLQSNAQAYSTSLQEALEVQRVAIADYARQLRQLHHIAEARATDLGRASAEIIMIRQRSATMAADLDTALSREAAMHAQLAQAGLETAALAAHLHGKAHAMAVEVELGRQQIHRLQHSTSWRITRPLRALKRPGRSMRILFGRKPD